MEKGYGTVSSKKDWQVCWNNDHEIYGIVSNNNTMIKQNNMDFMDFTLLRSLVRLNDNAS